MPVTVKYFVSWWISFNSQTWMRCMLDTRCQKSRINSKIKQKKNRQSQIIFYINYPMRIVGHCLNTRHDELSSRDIHTEQKADPVIFFLAFKTSLNGVQPFMWKWVLLASLLSCKSNLFARARLRFETEVKGTSKWFIDLLICKFTTRTWKNYTVIERCEYIIVVLCQECMNT